MKIRTQLRPRVPHGPVLDLGTCVFHIPEMVVMLVLRCAMQILLVLCVLSTNRFEASLIGSQATKICKTRACTCRICGDKSDTEPSSVGRDWAETLMDNVLFGLTMTTTS